MPVRRERLAVTTLFVAYATWIALITGKTPFHPLPDQFGLAGMVFALQAGPSLVAAAVALADAGVGGRFGIVRWAADCLALSAVLAIAGFAVFIAVLGGGWAHVPAAAALLLFVLEVRIVLRLLSRRTHQPPSAPRGGQ